MTTVVQLGNEDGMKITLAKGSLGVSATIIGNIVSMSSVKEWLQVVSLLVGIAVGVATFISIVRKRRK